MGQAESKQKLEQITNSLHKIRKDVRNGRITSNDVERIHAILQRFSSEIDVNLSKKVRASDVYTAEQLIEITAKELDALKQEVQLDATPTNSLKRASSKNLAKEKRLSLKEIKDEVEDIRKEVRRKSLNQQEYERFQNALVRHSQKLSTKKNKKNEVEIAQKLISVATEELLMKHHAISRRQSTASQADSKTATMSKSQPEIAKPTKTKSEPVKAAFKSQPDVSKILNTSTASTLDDIENKLEALKNDLKVAEANKDKSRLHFLSKSIQTLMRDLQMVSVKNQILNEERKALLEKNLFRAQQQIDTIKKEVNREGNISYLTDLHNKEKKQKTLQDLDDIEKTFKAIGRNASHQNYDSEKRSFNLHKAKLSSIEEDDQDVLLKKAEVNDVMLNLENIFTRLDMEARLNQAEWKHFKNLIDLSKFEETEDGEIYKKHRRHLLQLAEYVSMVLEINQSLAEKKKYVMYNIDNNIAALDSRAKENGQKLKPTDQEVVLRRSNSKVKSEDDLMAACKDIASNYTRDELKDVAATLTESKRILENKLKEIDAPELVKVKGRYLELVNHTLPPSHSQLEQIQKEVDSLQRHIENSRYNKDSQLYQDLRLKLNSYKTQVTNLTGTADDKLANSVLKSIDSVLVALHSNASKRRSTTEDILVDMMSVSTRINELGSKIEAVAYSPQDSESIKSSLQEHQQYLKNLKIAANRTSLLKSREDILKQIQDYLSDLNNVKLNGAVSEEAKRFNQELRKVKDKVNRYSGTYRSVLYKAIENDLDKHLSKVDNVFDDSNLAVKIKRDIENSKKILEQKSSKDQTYNSAKRNVRAPAAQELTEIRDNVESVKRELAQIRPLTKEELDKLEARLRLSILALDNIKDDHSKEERDKLYRDIHFYFDRIQELMLVSRPHSILLEDLQQKQMDQEQIAAQTIAKIESDLEAIKPSIVSFVGTETSQKFVQLDEVLVNGTMKLDELTLDHTSELNILKLRLMREFHKYSDILEQRSRQTEELERLEKDVKVMLMKIDSFNGYVGDSEYASLDEEIIRLKVSLGKLHVNQELIAKREACMQEVDSCMRKLNEAAKTRPDGYEGTLV